MTSMLLTADWHLEWWSTRSADYRNQQPLLLADFLVKYGEKHNITKLAILGDFFNHYSCVPSLVHLAKKVLTKLTTQFEVYIIPGNHDSENPSNALSSEESLVSMFDDYTNVFFMNNEILDIEGVKVQFCPWVEGDDLTKHVKEGVSVVLGHQDLNICLTPDSVKEVFLGHIHLPSDNGKNHSIGSPYQLRVGDFSESMIRLDFPTLNFERISTSDTEHKYIRMFKSNELPNPLYRGSEDEVSR